MTKADETPKSDATRHLSKIDKVEKVRLLLESGSDFAGPYGTDSLARLDEYRRSALLEQGAGVCMDCGTNVERRWFVGENLLCRDCTSAKNYVGPPLRRRRGMPKRDELRWRAEGSYDKVDTALVEVGRKDPGAARLLRLARDSTSLPMKDGQGKVRQVRQRPSPNDPEYRSALDALTAEVKGQVRVPGYLFDAEQRQKAGLVEARRKTRVLRDEGFVKQALIGGMSILEIADHHNLDDSTIRAVPDMHIVSKLLKAFRDCSIFALSRTGRSARQIADLLPDVSPSTIKRVLEDEGPQSLLDPDVVGYLLRLSDEEPAVQESQCLWLFMRASPKAALELFREWHDASAA